MSPTGCAARVEVEGDLALAALVAVVESRRACGTSPSATAERVRNVPVSVHVRPSASVAFAVTAYRVPVRSPSSVTAWLVFREPVECPNWWKAEPSGRRRQEHLERRGHGALEDEPRAAGHRSSLVSVPRVRQSTLQPSPLESPTSGRSTATFTLRVVNVPDRVSTCPWTSRALTTIR